MREQAKDGVIVVAEDDEDDYFLTKRALEKGGACAPLRRVKDGEDLMEFLLRRNPQAEGMQKTVLLILLDWNMPGKDGRQALREIKNHPALKTLPVIVFTSSRDPKDLALGYELGCNSFIRKPQIFEERVAAMAALKNYWLDAVELPVGE